MRKGIAFRNSAIPRSLAALLVLAAAVLLAAAGAPAQSKKKPLLKPVNINTATSEELQQVPGIGPVTAKAIVRTREKSGPFRRVEDLLAIRGIGRSRLEKMRPYVTVGPGKAPGKVGSR